MNYGGIAVQIGIIMLKLPLRHCLYETPNMEVYCIAEHSSHDNGKRGGVEKGRTGQNF